MKQKHVLKVCTSLMMLSFLFLIGSPLVVALAALGGWTVQIFFGDAIAGVLHAVGLDALAAIPLWKTSAALAYFSSYLIILRDGEGRTSR